RVHRLADSLAQPARRIRLHPVANRLLGKPKALGHRAFRLARANQPHRLALKLKRVARPPDSPHANSSKPDYTYSALGDVFRGQAQRPRNHEWLFFTIRCPP